MGELILYGGLLIIASLVLIMKTLKGRVSLTLKRKRLERLKVNGDEEKYRNALVSYKKTLMEGMMRTLFNLQKGAGDKFASFAYGECFPAYMDSGDISKSTNEEELRLCLSELREFLNEFFPDVDQDSLGVFKARGSVNRITKKGEKFDGELEQLMKQVFNELSPYFT
ncbi:MAG: hypothetical protein P1V20_21295 [Verrucomicrobiales bacterium]|nr:hypothetical protein [Verrucomicrobiales bacterium]